MNKQEILYIKTMDGVTHSIIPSRIATYAKGNGNDIWYSGGYLIFNTPEERDEQFDILDKAILASMFNETIIIDTKEPVEKIVPTASNKAGSGINIGDVTGDVTIH